MSHDAPPNMDESYWQSLLSEGEFSRSVQPDLTTETTEILTLPPTHHSDAQSDWDEARRIMQADEVLRLTVVGYNRGGLLVDWRSLRGFVPASQLVSFTSAESAVIRRDALTERIDDQLSLRIIEIDPQKNRLILSERAAQVENGARSELLQRIHVDDILTGVVTNLCDFGAFVDLGGIEGLIHISELSWGRVGHPADLLSRNQEVRVHVLEVDPSQSRVALSLKRLTPDPWATVEQRYTVGEIIEGRITNVVDFGAFACIEDGLEGLIHFSELAEGHFLHPRNVVKEGEWIKARILTIDGKSRRLGLTLRVK